MLAGDRGCGRNDRMLLVEAVVQGLKRVGVRWKVFQHNHSIALILQHGQQFVAQPAFVAQQTKKEGKGRRKVKKREDKERRREKTKREEDRRNCFHVGCCGVP